MDELRNLKNQITLPPLGLCFHIVYSFVPEGKNHQYSLKQ